MAVDPRLQGNEDKRMPIMFPGQRILENIGGIRGGTAYTDDVEGWASDSRWLEFYATVSQNASSPHLARFYLKLTGASNSIWGSTLRAEYQQAHTSGKASGGGQAVHAEAILGTGNVGVEGYLAALRGVLNISAETRNLEGRFAACFLTTVIGTGNVMPDTTSFIAMEQGGNVAPAYLLDTKSIPSGGDGKIWETTSDAVNTVLGYYRINTAAGAGYLVVYADHA